DSEGLRPENKTRTGPVQSHRRLLRGLRVRRGVMQASIFNIRVPLKERDDVFLMNTLTDAQLIVSPDVAALLDRTSDRDDATLDEFAGDEREAIDLLRDNG